MEVWKDSQLVYYLQLGHPSLSAELVDDEEPEDALIEDNKPIENPSRPPFNPSTTRSTTRRPIPAIATTFRPTTPQPRLPLRGSPTPVSSSSFRGSPSPGSDF